MKYLTVAEMQAVEGEADAAGLSYAQMMENAGSNLAQVIAEMYADLQPEGVLALVGSGNNGGDALVALAHLAAQGWPARAYLVRPRPDDPLVARAQKAGVEILLASEDPDDNRLLSALENCAVILDGVLGTGARLPLKPEVAGPLEAARQALEAMSAPPLVVAVDCPSGVDCDSGQAAPEAIPADLTVTMAAVKQGLLKLPAFTLLGDLQVVGIGVESLEASLPTWEAAGRMVPGPGDIRQLLPERPEDAHKGTFGTALILAGSLNYTGAALLAGKAAYRCGAGLVTLGIPSPLHSALAGQLPEATWLLLPHEMGVIADAADEIVRENLERVTAMLVGPGLGMEDTTQEFISRLIGVHPSSGRARMGFVPRRAEAPASETRLPPMVIDADGLKLLARLPDWAARLPAPAILTPHPGEMSILTGLPVEEIQADRLGVAERFSRQWGHVVVLKGAFTVVAAPAGTVSTAVLPVATPALARAGTGDVLAGLIVGLRAQGLDAFSAALAGAWIHGQAGLWAAENVESLASVLAGDVLDAIPQVLSELGY